ncbi:MAG: hypothetical protein ACR2QC_04960, partial [Gammaproteobacteria bacterium]
MTSAANAQQAQARVYSVPTATFTIGGRTVNLGETLAEIIADFTNGVSPFGGLPIYFARLEAGGTQSAANSLVGDDGLPTFGGTVGSPGDPVAAGD